MRAIRIAVVLLAFATSCPAENTMPGPYIRAAKNDELLLMAGVDLDKVILRLPCTAMIEDGSDHPAPFGCVYVQSSNEISLFSLDGDYLISELQLKFHAINGIALKDAPVMNELQIFSGERLIRIHISGKLWPDKKKTAAAYRSLLENSLPARQPVPLSGT